MRRIMTHSWIAVALLVAACDLDRAPVRPESTADSVSSGAPARALAAAEAAALLAALEDACDRVTSSSPDSRAARQLREAVRTLAGGLEEGDLRGMEPVAELARDAAAAVPDAARADMDALALTLDILHALTHPTGASDAAQR